MADNPTLADVLAHIPRDEAMTGDAVLAISGSSLGEALALDIAGAGPFPLLLQLATVLPNEDEAARAHIARTIIAFLNDMGLSPVQAQPPIAVTVETPKSLADMTLRELLERLVADPSQYREIQPFIGNNPLVQAARLKTEDITVCNADGSVNVDLTLIYIQHLATPHTVPQSHVQALRPVTLEAALGIKIRPYIHPFTGMPVTGPDELGFDCAQLPDDLHRALLWAQVTGHHAWPQSLDRYTASTEVLQSPLPPRWQRILDDFLHFQQTNPDDAAIYRRHWPDGLSPEDALREGTAIRSQGGSSDDHYRRLLEQRATDGRVTAPNKQVRGGVYGTLRVSSTNVTLDNVIILLPSRLSGPNMGGTVYVPYGVSIHDSGVNSDLRVVPSSWKELAEIAGLA